jgi:hypothetical protein
MEEITEQKAAAWCACLAPSDGVEISGYRPTTLTELLETRGPDTLPTILNVCDNCQKQWDEKHYVSVTYYGTK